MTCDSSETSVMDKFFSNCVDDYIKVRANGKNSKQTVKSATQSCKINLQYTVSKEQFRYFKGKIFSAGF